jgi:2-keto-4-pentenoate hydratase
MTMPEQVACALLEAERTRVPIEPLSEADPDLSIAGAYAIQSAGRALRLAEGAVQIGHKVGLTSTAMQQMLSVDQPDFGYLTDAMLSESGRVLPSTRFIAPRVEAEVAFRLRDPLSGPSVTIDDVLAATEAVAPAIEIIDSRIADWRITIADTIADNASCGHVVIGEWRALDGIDLATEPGRMVVRAQDGGETVVEGRGDAVLGHPAAAIAWLARALHELAGGAIGAGDIVIPGAVARAVPLAAGGEAWASMGAVGAVTVRFDDDEQEGRHG